MSLPYYPMYPKNYEAKAGWLSLAQDGAYNRLLRLCWMTSGCSLPNDHEWIRRRLRVSEEQYSNDVLPVIEEFFEVKKVRKNSRLINPKLSEEFLKAKTKYSNKKSAAKKARIHKSLKNKASNEGKSTLKSTLISRGEKEKEKEIDIQSSKGAELLKDYKSILEMLGSLLPPEKQNPFKDRVELNSVLESVDITTLMASLHSFYMTQKEKEPHFKTSLWVALKEGRYVPFIGQTPNVQPPQYLMREWYHLEDSGQITADELNERIEQWKKEAAA